MEVIISINFDVWKEFRLGMQSLSTSQFDTQGGNIMYEISIGSVVLDANPELRDKVYGDYTHDEGWMDF